MLVTSGACGAARAAGEGAAAAGAAAAPRGGGGASRSCAAARRRRAARRANGPRAIAWMRIAAWLASSVPHVDDEPSRLQALVLCAEFARGTERRAGPRRRRRRPRHHRRRARPQEQHRLRLTRRRDPLLHGDFAKRRRRGQRGGGDGHLAERRRRGQRGGGLRACQGGCWSLRRRELRSLRRYSLRGLHILTHPTQHRLHRTRRKNLSARASRARGGRELRRRDSRLPSSREQLSAIANCSPYRISPAARSACAIAAGRNSRPACARSARRTPSSRRSRRAGSATPPCGPQQHQAGAGRQPARGGSGLGQRAAASGRGGCSRRRRPSAAPKRAFALRVRRRVRRPRA